MERAAGSGAAAPRLPPLSTLLGRSAEPPSHSPRLSRELPSSTAVLMASPSVRFLAFSAAAQGSAVRQRPRDHLPERAQGAALTLDLLLIVTQLPVQLLVRPGTGGSHRGGSLRGDRCVG